ncbi:hypothetical protein [Sphingomonas yabuuchiae]|uniref:hypothetical protein n=1 Tax=Sphingomonas yabuuchiae TaxID=172044 RepID=UPI003D977572
MRTLLWVGAMALACLSTSAAAQTFPLSASPEGWARPTSPCVYDPLTRFCTPVSTATPLPVAGRQESVALATANTPIAPTTLYGGNYIFTQACTAYGSVALRYRAPDGSMITLATKVVGDTGGGTAFQFGTSQVVDVLLTGTTGCNVTLSRIP